MPQFNQRKLFECLTVLKKMPENAKILECRMALGHAMTLTPWWADSSCFSNACFAFSCFLKNNFFMYDHETLSYLATNSLKPI